MAGRQISAAGGPGDTQAVGQQTPPGLEQVSAKIYAAAADLARTEDRIAATLEQMAEHRPHAANRLTAKATQARQFAAWLRDYNTKHAKSP